MKTLPVIIFLPVLLLVSSCAVGPNYKKPSVADLTPPVWHWKIAEPKDETPKGAWWNLFQDPALDELEKEAVANNQNLRAAMARVDEARAAARLSRSQFFPELSLDPSFKRERTSGHLPTPIPFKVPSAHINTFSVPLDLSYEVDLWGRIRRSFESARAQAEASAADYQNVLLTLTADVSVDYFLVRSLDVELDRLRRSIELYDQSVAILLGRFDAGVIPEIDLAQARAEAADAKVEIADLKRQRAETVHALALLCGRPASSFEISEESMHSVPAPVPVGLPSSLLERRPDIARAERNLAAKNAQIGVARAAYFPALRLTGQAGYLSAEADTLFSGDSRVWSIGPSVSLPLFNAGRTKAEVRQAESSYQGALADYRQAVLAAFKEVEDSLAQIVLRSEEAAAQADALAAARTVARLARARYETGTVNYLEAIDAQRRVLVRERQDAQIEGQRFAANIRLIKALGGGWQPEARTGVAPLRSDSVRAPR